MMGLTANQVVSFVTRDPPRYQPEISLAAPMATVDHDK